MTAATPSRISAAPQLLALGLPAALGAVVGLVSWGPHLAGLLVAPVVVLAWARQPTRLQAWLLVLAYYLAAARGLPSGAARFYGPDAPAVFSVALWLGASLALAAPWALLWGRAGWWWRLPACLVLCILPPVGIVGWANPLTAAAVFFPGAGWSGLAAMLLGLVALCHAPQRSALGLALLAALAVHAEPPPAPPWISAENTAYGGSGAAGRDYLRDYAANVDLVRRAGRARSRVVVYPETVAGRWTSATADLWAVTADRLAEQGRTVLVGAEVPIEGGSQTRNALAYVGAEHGALYQRVPVPFSMWKPWTDAGTIADPFGDGIGQLHGRRVASFICYEQLLVWPMLLSLAASPDLLIGAANDYWAASTSIPAIQTMTLRAWSQLFGVPLVAAVNL